MKSSFADCLPASTQAMLGKVHRVLAGAASPSQSSDLSKGLPRQDGVKGPFLCSLDLSSLQCDMTGSSGFKGEVKYTQFS